MRNGGSGREVHPFSLVIADCQLICVDSFVTGQSTIGNRQSAIEEAEIRSDVREHCNRLGQKLLVSAS